MSQDKPVKRLPRERSPKERSPREISPRERSPRLPYAYRKRNSISSSCSHSDYNSEDDYKKVKQKSYKVKRISPTSLKSLSSAHSKQKESYNLKRKNKKKSKK